MAPGINIIKIISAPWTTELEVNGWMFKEHANRKMSKKEQ